jgi:hypothetical protein
MILSKRYNALVMIFSCPLVMGSNEPGKTARRSIVLLLSKNNQNPYCLKITNRFISRLIEELILLFYDIQ